MHRTTSGGSRCRQGKRCNLMRSIQIKRDEVVPPVVGKNRADKLGCRCRTVKLDSSPPLPVILNRDLSDKVNVLFTKCLKRFHVYFLHKVSPRQPPKQHPPGWRGVFALV